MSENERAATEDIFFFLSIQDFLLRFLEDFQIISDMIFSF